MVVYTPAAGSSVYRRSWQMVDRHDMGMEREWSRGGVGAGFFCFCVTHIPVSGVVCAFGSSSPFCNFSIQAFFGVGWFWFLPLLCTHVAISVPYTKLVANWDRLPHHGSISSLFCWTVLACVCHLSIFHAFVCLLLPALASRQDRPVHACSSSNLPAILLPPPNTLHSVPPYTY